jgi:hypothetical protein
MAKKNIAMCPLFDDVPCPQGEDAAEQCRVRFNADYDPVKDFKDYLFMECAILRAHQKEEQMRNKNEN